MLFVWDFVLFSHHRRISSKIDKIIEGLKKRELVKIHTRPAEIKNQIKFLEDGIAYNNKRISEISPARELEIKVLKGENSIFTGIKKTLEELL